MTEEPRDITLRRVAERYVDEPVFKAEVDEALGVYHLPACEPGTCKGCDQERDREKVRQKERETEEDETKTAVPSAPASVDLSRARELSVALRRETVALSGLLVEESGDYLDAEEVAEVIVGLIVEIERLAAEPKSWREDRWRHKAQRYEAALKRYASEAPDWLKPIAKSVLSEER